jgi:glycosyltransferase involved in cell wall biosynthesis
MVEQPLVSIVTPSYNQGAFIEATIRSVLSQDYPNLAYWIIDGGSTDGTLEIIEKYADRLTGYLSEPDQGQADAINKGFRQASGEIMAWINSDDLYRPHAIQNAVRVLGAHPQVGLVYSDVDSIDANGECFNRMQYDQWQLADLMAFKILGQPSVFFRRSVWEDAGGLDASYHFLLDHHLWLRMALNAPIKYVPGQVWSAARMHAGAKNVADADGFGGEAYRLVDWMAADEHFKGYYQNHARKVWAGAHRLNAFYLLNGDQPAACLRAYWRGFTKDPGTVLKDWRRILFALGGTLLEGLSPVKINSLRDSYLARRKKRLLRSRLPAESESDNLNDENGI